MRTILVLALFASLLAAVGIIHIQKRGERLNVSIDTGRLEDEAEDLIDAVRDRLSDDDAARDRDESSIRNGFERLEGRIDDARDAVDEFADDVESHVRDARRRIEN